jgi:hypothetical protein
MASDRFVIGDGEVDEVIGLAPGELPLGVLYALPLHTVLRRDLAEVGLDDGGVLAARQTSLVGAGAPVELALGLHQSIDAHCCLAGLNCRGGECRQGRQQEEEP